MKTLFALALASAVFLLTSCSDSDSDSTSQVQQEQLLQEGNRQVGMPDIHNYWEKKFLKMAIELRDNPKAINYEYAFSEMTGKYTYIGRCVGLGLSFSTQFTSPQKVIEKGGYYVAVPQADPNGLFMPASDAGTVIAEINPETHEIDIVRAEETTRISQHKLRASIVMNPQDQEADTAAIKAPKGDK